MSDDAEYRCFIGNLSWSTDDRGLQDAFKKFGHVSDAKVVMDKYSGRSRGFGFVTFEDKAAMEDAIDSMNGRDLDGRAITVDKAQPNQGGGDRDRDSDRSRDRDGGRDRERRDYGGGGGGRGGGRGGGGDCFKCGKPGHFARECPDDGGSRGGSRYGGRDDKYSSGGGGSRYSSGGPERNGDRYGSSRSSGGGGGDRGDRYSRDRSGPYDRRDGGSYR